MPQDVTQDMIAIREWMAKEPYLPTDIGDLLLRKFLHSCYNSLEKTKKCIERFTCTRSTMSEVYNQRDPLAANLQTSFSITKVATYTTEKDEILIHQLDDPTLEKFSFYDVLKTLTIQGDYWLMTHDLLPSGHILILDIKNYYLKILPKVNVMFFRDFLIYLLEGMPVRVKHVHLVNCPPYYDKLYSLVKPVLPEEICNIIKFHSSPEGLYKHIDRKYLPKDYGGDAASMKTVHEEWQKKVETNRKIFLNENMWKADLKKKPKNKTDTSMSGSFKTLSID